LKHKFTSQPVVMFIFFILPRLVLVLVLAGIFGGIFLALKRCQKRRIFLGIYTALLVLLLADAVFDGRSIPGNVLRWIKGEQGMNQIADDYFDDTRKTIDPVEIQRWAVAMLQQYPQTDSSVVKIPPDKIPAYVQNPKGYDLKDHYVQAGAVYLGWGGGLGHFGLCVGPPTFKTALEPDPDNPYGTSYIEWQPGIYFWIQ
jgi:hypothetical protein